ncbi:hypothetical protein CRE_16447 [Caenorhabditis remanei]|uniref:Serpentine Receptor, class H n=1 Tax=Caenorhabditis remanei TaxID=31234 RepID=E3NF90_CAERE|nr:hypothetical protein CRE_16447 [Caenorhabditis remanei]
MTTPVNFYGIYLILFKSEKTLKNAKWVMLNSQSWSTLTSLLLNTFLLPFLILPVVGGHPSGLFTHLGIPVTWQVFIGFGSIAQVGCSMVIVFENQQNHVVGNGIKLESKSHRRIFAVVNIILGFTFVLPVLLQVPDQEKARRNVMKWFICPFTEFSNLPLFILAEDSYVVSCAVSGMLAIYIFEGLFFIFHSAYHLAFKTRKLSNRTRTLQRKFFIVVCIQIFLPFSIIGLPVCYLVFSVSSGYHNQFLNNISIILMSLHSFLSTIFMIIMRNNMKKEGILCCSRNNGITSSYQST